MTFCTNCGTAAPPATAGEGAQRSAFCVNCGQALPPTVPQTYAAPPVTQAWPPAVMPAQGQPNGGRNMTSIVAGFLAIVLIAGGITFLMLRNNSGDANGSATSTIVGAPTSVAGQQPATTVAATVATTVPGTTVPAAPVDPLTRLQQQQATDAPAVETLVGQWVPQVSSKRPGIEADGIVYDLQAIVELHAKLQANFGALLLFSGDFNYQSNDLWVSIVPQGYATPQQALQFCVANSIGRDDCFAKLITRDPSITDTVQLQP